MRKGELKEYRDYISACGHSLVDSPVNAEIILLWTCAFRQDVLDNSLEEIARYQKEFKAEVIVGGCLPDIDQESLRKVFIGRTIPWRKDKDGLAEVFGTLAFAAQQQVEGFLEPQVCVDASLYKKENPGKDVTFHDQFIKLVVSEGCNYECSYCSERLAFPVYRSIQPDALLKLLKDELSRTACRKVILLSDSLGDYGGDIGTDLPALIKALRTLDKQLQFALNNLNPAGFRKFFKEFERLFSENAIAHLNIPIQSASENLLKLMRRPYGRAELDEIFIFLNRINFKEFDTHVLIGFPGETAEDFIRTVDFILYHKPKYVLASGYMETANAPSRLLTGKVDVALKNERMDEFTRRMNAGGIICNADKGDLVVERLRRMNLI